MKTILDGIEEYLELERELGVRAVEFDRTLLDRGESPPSAAAVGLSAPPGMPVPARSPIPPPAGAEPSVADGYDFVFLHDKPLSAKGGEMMAKIITAMHRTADTAPVLVVPPLPKAKYYVVLGGLAMRKYFPGMSGAPGQWLKANDGKRLLVTFSPEYILRFPEATPAVKGFKRQMWDSLKTLMKKI